MRIAGVDYEVNWKGFTRGRAVFFPCLDPKAAWREVRPVLRRLKFKTVRRAVVDPVTGVRGLRIWRL
jgi:hypothetical protein